MAPYIPSSLWTGVGEHLPAGRGSNTLPLTTDEGLLNYEASTPFGSLASPITASSLALPSSSALGLTRAPLLDFSRASTSISPMSSAISDMQIILSRRYLYIALECADASDITTWVSNMQADGSWSDIDYTAGCDAQRANWPAQGHWVRLVTLAAAWHGDLNRTDNYKQDPVLGRVISAGMSYWFDRDFKKVGCLAHGGMSSCPCGASSSGFWNRNWYSNVIGTPRLVAETCLLAQGLLSSKQLASCISIPRRAYNVFHDGEQHGFLAGANIFNIASIGVDLALLTADASLMAEAYGKIHDEIVVKPGTKVDGIKPDGSFSQHAGLLYSGNYGKDTTNDILELELLAAGTQFAANSTSVARSAFETLIDGDLWMVYRNTATGVLHWDTSVLSRFISFPVADGQATASLNINLTNVLALGQQWRSTVLINAQRSLAQSTTDANAGQIVGNRMFWANDYMVQRGQGYVSTLKMYSSRTLSTECTNSQNPYGFHLADGALFTYLDGTEYEDIAAAWDWDAIPGTTTAYNSTPLDCDHARWTSKESFVGGVSTGSLGVAAMRYTNPYTKSLSWQKAIFFLDEDTQLVMVSNIKSNSNAPVRTILDQRRYAGSISRPSKFSLWHGGVGYIYAPSSSFTLSARAGPSTGDWKPLGISTQRPATVNLFTAWIEHKALSSALAYYIYPATTLQTFQAKSSSRTKDIATLQNDAHISAAYDAAHRTFAAVFWDPLGGSISFSDPIAGAVTVQSSAGAALIFCVKDKKVTLADPTQLTKTVKVFVTMGGMKKALTFSLPTDGRAGSSTIARLS